MNQDTDSIFSNGLGGGSLVLDKDSRDDEESGPVQFLIKTLETF